MGACASRPKASDPAAVLPTEKPAAPELTEKAAIVGSSTQVEQSETQNVEAEGKEEAKVEDATKETTESKTAAAETTTEVTGTPVEKVEVTSEGDEVKGEKEQPETEKKVEVETVTKKADAELPKSEGSAERHRQ